MPDGKITCDACRSATKVQRDRIWPKDATMTFEAKAKAKIDVFAITEEAFVKSANVEEYIAPDEGACPARAEALTDFR